MYKGFIIGFGPIGAMFYSMLKRVDGLEMRVVSGSEKPVNSKAFVHTSPHLKNKFELVSPVLCPPEAISRSTGPKLIFITVKAGDLEKVMQKLTFLLDQDSEIVLCQNGIGIREIAERYFPKHQIHRVVVFTGASWVDDQESFRSLSVSPANPRIEFHSKLKRDSLFKQFLTRGGFQITELPNVDVVEWRKAISNIYANALLAITGLETSYAVTDDLLNSLSWKLAEETLGIAWHLEIELTRDYVSQIRKVTSSLTTHRCSTLVDIQMGRKTEVEWLNGAIVRAGKNLGVPTPYNEMITSIIKTFENHKIAPSKITSSIPISVTVKSSK